MSPPFSASALANRLSPLVFVFLWSTGWIIARYSADYADPLTFLLVRYLSAGAVLFVYALAAGASWPKSPAEWGHALATGVLLHAIYLGGVWWAVRHGLPASISALIAALQPILTALFAPWLVGERVKPMQWLGVVLGFFGIALVLSPKLASVAPGALASALAPIVVNVVAMFSITFGAFYQKRAIHSGDLRTVTVLQYVGAIAVTLPLAWALEPMKIEWNATMFAVLAWSVFAVSIGAIALLLLLIRRGEVSRSAQLIYLVPPTAALQAYALFGEKLSPAQIAGMIVTAAGVAMATRPKP